MKPPADAPDFVATVAGHFIARRGRGALLSPADLSCLATWEDEGVGVDAAVRGIDEAFRRGGEIRSLRQCRWAVEEEYRKSQAGGAGSTEKEPPIENRLAALAAALDEAAREVEAPYREPFEEAAAAVRKLTAEAGREGAGETQATLDAVEDELLAGIEAAVPAEERAALAAAAEKKLRGRGLSAEVARRTVRAITLRELRRRWRLPSFAI